MASQQLGGRLNNLQVLRGLAALMVVLVHLGDVEAKLGGAVLLHPWSAMGAAGVDLFFALSGFVMILSAGDRPGGLKDARDFAFARVTRIYPVWWLCLTALAIVWLIKPSMVFSSVPGTPTLWKDYLLWPASREPLHASGWTLIHEMYFYIVLAVLLALGLSPRVRFWTLCGWMAAVAALSLAPFVQAFPETVIATHPLTLEFFGGAMAAYALRRFNGKGGAIALALGVACFFPGAAFLGLYLPTSGIPQAGFADDWARTLAMVWAGPLLCYGAAALEVRGRAVRTGFLTALGDWSYSLYLTHIIVINVLSRLWKPLANPGLLDNLIALPLILAGCVLFARELYLRFERPSLNFLRAARKRIAARRALGADASTPVG